MLEENLERNDVNKTPDEIIYDTTMMFTACAAYVLQERNGFDKQAVMQFLTDIEQVNRSSEYKELQKVLNGKYGMDFPGL